MHLKVECSNFKCENLGLPYFGDNFFSKEIFEEIVYLIGDEMRCDELTLN